MTCKGQTLDSNKDPMDFGLVSRHPSEEKYTVSSNYRQLKPPCTQESPTNTEHAYHRPRFMLAVDPLLQHRPNSYSHIILISNVMRSRGKCCDVFGI